MATIKVNGLVNGLVHKGGSWISTATLPDVCKTPTPGGPVPMPYPNVSMQSSLTKGTKTVKVDGGNMAAIKGSKYATSTGDEPGTLGGIKSNTFKRASTWILYSFDVKLDGKNACRFSDKKFQNNENTVDAGGVLPQIVQVEKTSTGKCGDLNQYGNQPSKPNYDRDHVPSFAALKKAAQDMGLSIGKCESKLRRAALSIVIPSSVHSNFSRTFRGKNKVASNIDKKDLQKAACDDLDEILKGLNDPACKKAYEKAAERVRKIKHSDYEKWLRETLANC